MGSKPNWSAGATVVAQLMAGKPTLRVTRAREAGRRVSWREVDVGTSREVSHGCELIRGMGSAQHTDRDTDYDPEARHSGACVIWRCNQSAAREIERLQHQCNPG